MKLQVKKKIKMSWEKWNLRLTNITNSDGDVPEYLHILVSERARYKTNIDDKDNENIGGFRQFTPDIMASFVKTAVDTIRAGIEFSLDDKSVKVVKMSSVSRSKMGDKDDLAEHKEDLASATNNLGESVDAKEPGEISDTVLFDTAVYNKESVSVKELNPKDRIKEHEIDTNAIYDTIRGPQSHEMDTNAGSKSLSKQQQNR